MASRSSQIDRFVNEHQLGVVCRTYKAPVVTLMLGGLLLMMLGCISLFGPFLGLLLFIFLHRGDTLFLQRVFSSMHLIILPFFLVSVFFLFGSPWIVLWGARSVGKGWTMRGMRVVLCAQGMVFVERTKTDALRWEQVASVAHTVRAFPYEDFDHPPSYFTRRRVLFSVRLSQVPGLGRNAFTTMYSIHRWTVKCKDKRTFVFEGVRPASKEFGKMIVMEVARRRQEIKDRIQQNDIHRAGRLLPNPPARIPRVHEH